MIEAKYMTEDELNAHKTLQKQVTEALRSLARQHIKLGGLSRKDPRVVNIKYLYSQMFNLSDGARKRGKVPEEHVKLPFRKKIPTDNPYLYQVVDEHKGQVFKGTLEEVAKYLGVKVKTVYIIRTRLKSSGQEFNISGIRIDPLGRKKDGI